MKILKKLYFTIAEYIHTMIKTNDSQEYNILMGLISSSMIALVELVSFFVVPRANVSTPIFFFVAFILMMIQFIFFLIIYKKQYLMKQLFYRGIIIIHPYLIILIGVMISYSYQGLSNYMASFLVGVFAASFIQIYPFKRRIAIYSFSILVFNLMMYFMHGFGTHFTDGLRYSLMIALLGYLYSMLQYLIHTNHQNTLIKLEADNHEKAIHLAAIKEAYTNLEYSKKITEAMMLISSEILKNDQFDDVLQIVLKEAIQVIPKAQAGSILIYNGKEMEFRAAYGYNIKKLQQIKLKMGDLFQATLLDKYEPVIIRDLETYDTVHVDEEISQALRSQNANIAKEVLSCSFKYNDEFYGTINVDIFNPDSNFDERDILMVKQLAKQLEITIGIHKLYEKAIRPTKIDELTQAYTRNYQKELLGKAFSEAIENKHPLSICTIDINNFKEINDLFGHDAGDDCLSFFAGGVHRFRTENIIFSRVGGDEFTLVMTNLDYQESLKHIEKLRRFFMKHPFQYNHSVQYLEFGCGISTYPQDGTTLADLIKLSDQRMYQDKANIKNTFGE